VLDSERSSLPGARAVGLNVELFYFFDIREKTDSEAFAKKSLGYLVDPELLIILFQTFGTRRHALGPRVALWNPQYLE
jgi:hypothetical protein